MDMRGLSIFISDIRKAATSKEAEHNRIEKELAKIRSKFKESTKLNGYDRKKYVCKLLYMFMLGYDIDFGHMEAVMLISSDKYSEKHIGYLACTLLLNENHDLLTLITNSIKSDLLAHKEHFQCLALTAVANVGGKDFAEAMSQDVQKILLNRDTKAIVRKKAGLCLLRLYRKYPEIITPEAVVDPVLELLGAVDFGVVNCLSSLLLGFLAKDVAPFQACVGKCIRVLSKIILSKDYTNDYVYYGVPAPWLQIKLFRILQHYPMPTDGALKNQITSVLNKIITASERVRSMDKSRTPSRNNSVNSVLIEAINLCIHYDKDRDLINMAASILGRFITDTKDTNLRYLGLATMSRLAYCSEGDAMEHIRKHQQTIVLSLKDSDISIRRRALDLLYCMCDKSNAAEIVGELLEYLTVADFNIREDLVLKIAILSERFATEYSWYVDVVMNIISQAGDFVSDDVYYRVVQIVTNHDSIQKHAADIVLKAVQSSSAHEVAVKVAGYVLGEFGYYIAEEDGSGPMNQFNALHGKFNFVSTATKSLLMNTYIKFYNMYDDETLHGKILKVFEENRSNLDAELQQRASEYYQMASSVDEDTVNVVLESMPVYNIKQSAVLTAMAKTQGEATDKNVWGEKKAARDAEAAEEAEEEAEEAEEEAEEEEAVAEAPAQQEEPNLLGDDDFLGGPVSTPAPAASAPASSAMDDPLGDLLGGPASTPAPAPTPAPAAKTDSLGLDDLLGGPSPAAAPAAASTGDFMDDIFSGGAPSGGGGGGFTGFSAPKGLDEAQVADQLAKCKALMLIERGVLYEDTNIQVGMKTEFHGATARAILFYGNKTAAPLSQLGSNVSQIPGLKLAANQVNPMLGPKTQVQQYLNLECQEAYENSPSMELTFEANGQLYKLPLQLPLSVIRFMDPFRMASNEQFFSTWRSTGPATAPSVVFRTGGPIDVNATQQTLTSLGFHVMRAVDKNNDNMVGCGQLISKKSPPIPVLVNVESNVNAQAVRLTVKSNDTNLLTAVQVAVRRALGDKAV